MEAICSSEALHISTKLHCVIVFFVLTAAIFSYITKRAPRSRRANDVGWFVRPAIRNCVAQWIVLVSSLKQHGLHFSQSGHELHSSHVLLCISLPVYGHAITQAYILCSPQVPGNLFASQLITYSNAETNNWYTKFLASLNTSSYGSMSFMFKTNVNVDTCFQLGSESGLTWHFGDQFCLILRVRVKRISIQLCI